MGSPIQQPSPTCRYGHDKASRSGTGCRQGCTCDCMFCVNARAEKQAFCRFGCDSRQTCPTGCSCTCRTCVFRRTGRHVCTCVCRDRCDAECSCDCRTCVARRAVHKHMCPLGHDERDGTHVECPTGLCENCNCDFCLKTHAAAVDRGTTECPFGHGSTMSPKPCKLNCRCVCGKCTAPDSIKVQEGIECPAGHRAKGGTHNGIPGTCNCHCRFCIDVAAKAATPYHPSCPYGHMAGQTDLKVYACPVDCQCLCLWCQTVKGHRKMIDEICPGGHCRQDGSHDSVECRCTCVFCQRARAGSLVCPNGHETITSQFHKDCVCLCKYCNQQRKEHGYLMGKPSTNDQPARPAAVDPLTPMMVMHRALEPIGSAVDAPKMPYGAVELVFVTGTLHGSFSNAAHPGIAVAEKLYVGDRCVVVEITRDKLVLGVSSRAGQGRSPLPPPQDAPPQRMSRDEAATLISMLHQGLIKWPDRREGRPLTAGQVLRMAESAPPAEEHFQLHECGTAFAAIIDILTGGRPAPDEKQRVKNWRNEVRIFRQGASLNSAAIRLSRILCEDESFSPHWSGDHWVLDNKGDWFLKIADPASDYYVVGTTIDMDAEQFGVIARGIAGILAVAGIPK